MEPHILLEECKYVIFLLKLLGLFPMQMNSAERFQCKFFMLPITYFVICYGFSMYIAMKQMMRRISIISNPRICNFDCLIFSLATLIVLIPTMLIPIAFWLNIKRTVLFWDDCYKFQIRFKNLTGKPIKIKIKKWVTFYLIISIVAVLLVTTLPSAFITQRFNFVATSTYYVVFGGFVAGVSYWLSVCLFLKQAANNILLFIDKAFQRWYIPYETIEICHELWSFVQSLLKQFGKSMEFFLLIYGFTLMLTMLNSMYGFTSQLYTTELRKENIKHAIGHFILFIWSSALIFIINESSYQVVNTFTYKLKQQILLINFNDRSKLMRSQITEFYQIFRYTNSKLSFSDFNEFSRAFFITILSAIITYMVILLQIRNIYLLSQKQMTTVNTCSNFTA